MGRLRNIDHQEELTWRLVLGHMNTQARKKGEQILAGKS